MTAAETDALDWMAPPDADAADAALKAAIQAELTEARGVEMRFLRRLDAEAETEEGRKDLPRLSNAAVKAARALRQIGVLQLEIAGLRDQPGVRPAPSAPANQNVPKPYVNGPKPRDFAWAHGDYTEYDDYKDWELNACQSAKMSANIEKISDAMYEDAAAHGRADLCKLAPIDLAKLITAIPHPALNRCLNAIEPLYAYLVFGEENVELTLRPGAGEALAEHDAKEALYADRRLDSS